MVNPFKPSVLFYGISTNNEEPDQMPSKCGIWPGSALFAHRMYLNITETETYYPTTLKVDIDSSNSLE